MSLRSSENLPGPADSSEPIAEPTTITTLVDVNSTYRQLYIEGEMSCLASDTTWITLDTEDAITALSDALCAEPDKVDDFPIRTLEVHVPSVSGDSLKALQELLAYLPLLTRLWMHHTEQLFVAHPLLAQIVSTGVSLTEVRFWDAGPTTHAVLSSMHARLRAVEVRGLPTPCTAMNLFLPSAATLVKIDIRSIALDVRERTLRFPRVQVLHVAFSGDINLLDLGAYKYAFPYLRELRTTRALPISTPQDGHTVRERNVLSGAREPGWAALDGLEVPPPELWLLGVSCPARTVHFDVDVGLPLFVLRQVLPPLRPRHLYLHFANAEDAYRVVRDFAALLAWSLPWPGVATLTLEIRLPAGKPDRCWVIVHLLKEHGARNVFCTEMLTVRFVGVAASPQPKRVLTALWGAIWDAAAEDLWMTCTMVRRVTLRLEVEAPQTDGSTRRTVMYTARHCSDSGVPGDGGEAWAYVNPAEW
ncbi:uncharacterized protein TRAVEDRAFT_41192 [Trametes versicolor FP-101664 SS1]|uniref:uncharacterized protein n=1 Tax=Trametes versicolor (strain FP-101664) TaxID=717944 RepID=UPI00046239AC|nr:uncharacterized protein TRAVEDRAFT_41192 [Trametes versicolor FP-101664 SS1]EIW63765.1 hypothetical protein TRAVEDRAFT_41192 [Trametes versicolor FP-101664 SS1]